MSTRIGKPIVSGELHNDKRNSVYGWLDVGDERRVRLELTGNLSGELSGRCVRFHPAITPKEADNSGEVNNAFEYRHCGVTGQIELRTSDEGKHILHLEWFSQRGQIVAEVLDPILEFEPVEEKAEDPTEVNPTDADPPLADAGLDFLTSETEAIDDVDDPYGLFPADLDQQLSTSEQDWSEEAMEEAGETLSGFSGEEEVVSQEAAPQERSWDEVIPGLDPETKRMYEEWDDVLHGTKDVPFDELFDPPLTIKRPVDLADEAEAIEQLRVLLARLALHCVVIHMCEHFTARETYRWLVDDLLPTEGVYPRLGPTGFFRHYDTSEHCPACEAEFDRQWNERHQDGE